MVERVQRRATKCVSELFNLDYEDSQAVALDLPSLSYRRHRADILIFYMKMSVYTLQCFSISNYLVKP